jgi:fucose permease
VQRRAQTAKIVMIKKWHTKNAMTNKTTSQTPVHKAQIILFLLGFTSNLIPAMTVYLKQYSALALWQISFFNTTSFVSNIFMAVPGYYAVQYYGRQNIAHMANVTCILGAISSGVCLTFNQPTYLFITVFIWSMGCILWRIVVCTYIMQFRKANDYHHATIKAFCADSLGAILCPLLFGTVFSNHPSQNILGKIIFFTLLSCCFSIAQHQFTHDLKSCNAPKTLPSSTLIKNLMQSKALQSGLAITFLFIGLEFTIPMIIADSPSTQPFAPSSLFVSLYWGNILLARLAVIKLLRTTSTHTVTHYSILISITATIMALAFPNYRQIILCCMGLSNANLYPYIFSTVSKKMPSTTHVLVSCILCMGLAGCGIVPSTMMMIRKYYGTNAIFILLCASYCLLLYVIKGNQQIKPMQLQHQTTP